MKINDQMPVYNPMASKTKDFSEGFMKLLDEPKHSMQGDDYYVQHQEQLQKSELTFAPLKDPQSQNKITLDDKVKSQSKTEPMESTSIAPRQLANNTLTHASLAKASRALTKELTLEPITERGIMQSCAAFISKEEPIEPRTRADHEHSLAYSPVTTSPVLKKHHLFVELQHAEFSVSAYDLKPKEQRQLVKLVESYLKKKGWSLKKLMINGVSHD